MYGDKKYTCWEVCVTTEWDMGIGKQVQLLFTGEPQKDTQKKM